MNGTLSERMARLIHVAPILFALCFTFQAKGQIVNIFDGYTEVCGGTLYDSGGETGVGYGPNENFTLTICAGLPGNAIRLEWTNFVLNGVDQVSIYDGFDTNAPLIGTYSILSVQNIVEASYANTNANVVGCLTLVFTSGPNGSGAFTASLSCFVPCEPPLASAVINDNEVPARVCIDEGVSFDASGSTAGQGFELVSYTWNFRDGSPAVTGPTAEHAFSEPGQYDVTLVVVDNNNCSSVNELDLRVQVGTEPTFAGLTVSDTEICQGEQVELTGVVNSPTWSNLPQPFIEGLTELPDGTGVTYYSTLNVSGFPLGTVVSSPNDITSVCMVMEHSFMGDLIVRLSSPSGQQVLLFDGNPGGGIYLGGANNLDDLDPGEGWLYCFQNTATLGTLAAEAQAGNTIIGGTNPPADAMPPGTYTSQESFSGFTGSNINGNWTLSILDDAAVDDGFIFEWYITVNPALYPDLVSFTPIYGTGADSTYWSGPGIVSMDPGADVATVAPNTLGANQYVYTVTNDFGCTYDTTITISVNPSIDPPVLISGNETVCIGSFTPLTAPAGFVSYTWSNGGTGQTISAGANTYTVTVSNGNCSLESEPFTVTGQPSPQPTINGPGFSCGGGLAQLSTDQPYASYAWSDGTSDATTSVATGSYTVTVTNDIGCAGTSPAFLVQIGSSPQAAYTTDPPSPQGLGTTVDFTDISQGGGSTIVAWSWTLGSENATSSSPSPTYTYNSPGDYPITLVITTADGCTDSIAGVFSILPESITIRNVFTPNGDGVNEYFEIENGPFYENTLQVFNRWGQQVYETKNYSNGWRATDLPDGTYFYVFTTMRDGKEYTGEVTILR